MNNIFPDYFVAFKNKKSQSTKKSGHITESHTHPCDSLDTATKKILECAFKILAHRRYTTAELKKKLLQKEPNSLEKVEKAMQCLKEFHYLNDTEYADFFIHDMLLRKPQGLRLLTLKLLQKGVSREIIDTALLAQGIDETAQAYRAVEKKMKLLTKYPFQKQRAKLVSFLFSRGFSSETIEQALTQLYKKF